MEDKMEDKFEKIYHELYEKNNTILEEAKKERNKAIVTIFLVCFIVNGIIAFIDKEKMVLLITISLSFIFVLICISKATTKYRNLFKKNIVTELVMKCDEHLQFSPETGLSKYDYSASHFDNTFDELYSEDRIFGILRKENHFQMAQITTKEVKQYKDENGELKKDKTETFKGIYGIVKLQKNSNAKIYIASNSIAKKYSANRVEMDSAAFEKEYDCLTEDKITAMKIFTADLLEKMLLFKKEGITGFEIKIEENMLYFRARVGEMFEPPKVKEALNKKMIKKYYNVIAIPIELIDKIIENIELL